MIHNSLIAQAPESSELSKSSELSISRTSIRFTTLLAVCIAVLVFLALAATMPGVGLTWDEPAYMGTAKAYGMWLTVLGRSLARLEPAQAFSESIIRQYWAQETADLHPPLGKVIPALTWRLLGSNPSDLTALRLGNAVIFAALVALVFIVGAQMWGLAAGLFAAASLTLMPRLFFHGHLTALDIPVALAWLCTVWLFWRWTVRGSTRLWPAMLVLGLAYGAALATKNTSFLLPPVLLLWALLFQRTRQAAVMLIGMGIIASLFFVISWPWLYTDLAGHLSEYVQRMTVGHWDISQYYLGRLYARPPWHYPFVVVAVTVPSTILLVALIGAGRVAAGGRQGKAGWLILMNALAPILFFAFVSGQAYGSERLFLVVFPFLALLAGMGFENIVTSLWSAMTGGLTHRQRQDASHSTGRAVVAACLAIMLLAPGLVGIISMHPYQLSYFSEIIGGAKGAEQAGLEITYWCETYQAALPFLNALPEANPSIWTEEDGVLYTYQQAGRLRGDARVGGRVVKAGPLAADYALIHRRPSGYSPDIERILRERTPVFTVRHANTDLAYVFKIQ